MAVTRIYALLDEKGRVRYVGKTNRSLEVRLSAHLRKAKYEQTHKDRWIVSMFRKQKLPTIQMIEMVNGDGCIEERKWIAFFRSIGVKLTNLTDGGDGLTGHIKSKETCKKLSDAHKGKIFSVEHKKNIGKASKGRPAWNKGKIGIYSEATRKKMGADKIGKKISEETRQKLRGRLSWLKGKHLPLVVRQKISKTRKALGLGSPMDGKRHTEKTKQKLKIAIQALWKRQLHPWVGKHHSEETKTKISKALKGKPLSEKRKQQMRDGWKKRRGI